MTFWFVIPILISFGFFPKTSEAQDLTSHTYTRCEASFSRANRGVPTPLSMRSKYQGEERGEYRDETTGELWNVRYFSEAERSAFEIFQRGGLFYDRNGKLVSSEFDAETGQFSLGIFVVDTKGRKFLLMRDERGKLHHSSLVAGGDVTYAGMAAFMNGYMRVLDDSSGHYHPSVGRTSWFARRLVEEGADLTDLMVTGRTAQHYDNHATLKFQEVQKYLLAPIP